MNEDFALRLIDALSKRGEVQVNIGCTDVTYKKVVKADTSESVEVVSEADEVVADSGETSHCVLPNSLRSERVLEFMVKLQKNNILDEDFKPLVSNRNASILADYIGNNYQVRNKWKDLGELWGIDKEVLRSTFNNLVDNDDDRAFCKRLSKL